MWAATVVLVTKAAWGSLLETEGKKLHTVTLVAPVLLLAPAKLALELKLADGLLQVLGETGPRLADYTACLVQPSEIDPAPMVLSQAGHQADKQMPHHMGLHKLGQTDRGSRHRPATGRYRWLASSALRVPGLKEVPGPALREGTSDYLFTNYANLCGLRRPVH